MSKESRRSAAKDFLIGVTLVLPALVALECGFRALENLGIRNPLLDYLATRSAPEPSYAGRSLPSSFRLRPVLNRSPRPEGAWPTPTRTEIKSGGNAYGRILHGVQWPEAGSYEVTCHDLASGAPAFSAIYTIGPFGYREIPQRAPGTRFVAFFGDSFTFGSGVQDDETYPAAFARKAGGAKVYNLGFQGYGLNDLFVRTRSEDIRSIVKEKRGLIVYQYNVGQVYRALGQVSYLATFGSDHPYLRETANGGIESSGSFRDEAPVRTWLSRLAYASSTLRFFNFDWPRELSLSQARFAGEIIASLRDHYRRLLPGTRFLVMVQPGETRSLGKVLRELDRRNIEYLDYSEFELSRYVRGNVHIPYDGHLTAEANEVLGEQLAEDLKSPPRRY